MTPAGFCRHAGARKAKARRRVARSGSVCHTFMRRTRSCSSSAFIRAGHAAPARRVGPGQAQQEPGLLQAPFLAQGLQEFLHALRFGRPGGHQAPHGLERWRDLERCGVRGGHREPVYLSRGGRREVAARPQGFPRGLLISLWGRGKNL